jgi:dCMP deaminase
MVRDSKSEYLFQIAQACARRSTCLRRKVGAILVDQYGVIISTGYNGAPSGMVDCLARGECWRDKNNIPHGEHYEKCFAVHAEANALLQAGKAARGCSLYLTTIDEHGQIVENLPCMMCARLLVNAGIKYVYVNHGGGDYTMYDTNAIYDFIHKDMIV